MLAYPMYARIEKRSEKPARLDMKNCGAFISNAPAARDVTFLKYGMNVGINKPIACWFDYIVAIAYAFAKILHT